MKVNLQQAKPITPFTPLTVSPKGNKFSKNIIYYLKRNPQIVTEFNKFVYNIEQQQRQLNYYKELYSFIKWTPYIPPNPFTMSKEEFFMRMVELIKKNDGKL